jgi:ACS family hexuronate transporter-like MFS transporter
VSKSVGRVRQWGPVVGMLLLSLLSYADRSVLAILSPTILADLHMSATQYGYAIAAFSYCYMAANPVWGYWIDRKGVWVTILVAVAVWSVASGGHALIVGVGSMCIARGVLGFGEGATFPAGLATVAETMPVEKRSFALGLAYSGGSLGAALAPLLIVPIALKYGWRATFVLTAVLGLVWVVLWVGLRWSGVWNSPQRLEPDFAEVGDGRVEARPLQEGAVEGGWVGAEGVSLQGRLRSRWNRDLFGTVAMYGLGAAPLAFGLYAAPLYLSRVLHVSQMSLGHLLWIPPAGWETGYLLWGWWADRRTARGAGRPVALFAAFSVAGFLILLAPEAARSTHPVAATMTLFYLQMFIAGGVVVLSLSDGMRVQPKTSAGFLAGIAISSWAAVTGALTPVLGHLFDARAYEKAFWLVACLPVLGTMLWVWFRTSTPRDTVET